MPTILTSQQRDDLLQHGNKPVPVVDPETNALYFLVPGELFERLRALVEDEPLDIRETYGAQSQAAGQSGWGDPEMDEYNDYDANRARP